MTKDSTFISQTDGPIHTPILYIWLISVLRNFEKKFFLQKNFKIVGLCRLGAYTGGVGAGTETSTYGL